MATRKIQEYEYKTLIKRIKKDVEYFEEKCCKKVKIYGRLLFKFKQLKKG